MDITFASFALYRIILLVDCGFESPSSSRMKYRSDKHGDGAAAGRYRRYTSAQDEMARHNPISAILSFDKYNPE